MTTRRGLGAGRGVGYKNLIPTDPGVHRQSARGFKQPQQINAAMRQNLYGWNDVGHSVNPIVRIQSIQIMRGEGNGREDPMLGKWQTFTSIKDADRRLREISNTAPRSGGYDKTDVIVTLDDGSTFKGKFDVKHFSQPNADLSIAQHIREELMFSAGKTERGAQWVKEGLIKPDRVKQAEEALQTWDLEG